MLIVIYLLLMLLSLVLWSWLTQRIWRVNPAAAGFSFFLMFPAIYWCWKLWNDPQARIRLPAIANLLVTVALFAMSYKIGSSEMDGLKSGAQMRMKKNAVLRTDDGNLEMANWCRQKHHAGYDPALHACIETANADPVVVLPPTATYAQLSTYLKRNGLDGEFDQTPTKAGAALLAKSGIAGVASFNFLPLSLQQKPITVLVCTSNLACVDYQRNASVPMLCNGNLLLFTPDSADDPRITHLQMAFSKYRPG